MKPLNPLKTLSPKWVRSPLRLGVILLFLALTLHFLLPVWAAPSSQYDALRLYTEALFEITQKYVWPKKEEDLIYGSLRGMMNSLDPDSSFFTPKEYQSYLSGEKASPAEAGLVLIVKDNLLTAVSVIDDSPATRAGLKPGDHIIKIDGQQVRNLTTQEAARRFQGAPNSQIKLQVLRNGEVKPLDLTVTLEPLGLSTVTSRYLEHDVAYVRIRYFNNDTASELASVLKNLKQHQPPIKGIILDLRNNARGAMEDAVRSTSLLLGDQQILTAKGRSPKSEESYKGKDRDLIFKNLPPVVVLVDQGTARAAEIMAGALRDQSRSTLLGAKTLGLCGLTKTFPLEDGSALMMTVSQCYTPKGDKIQGKGLEPGVLGATPKDEKADKKEPVREMRPETDPWVQQAVDLIISGKPQTAPKEKAL
ncbi:MAG: S41 family peptidase [Thermodesulfobacteriota bacterium]